MANTFFAPCCSRTSVKPTVDAPEGLHAEIAQRLFELQPAAADIRAGVAAHLDGRFGVKLLPRLVRLLPGHKDRAAHNDGLRLGAGLCKPALSQQHIQPFFILHAPSPP